MKVKMLRIVNVVLILSALLQTFSGLVYFLTKFFDFASVLAGSLALDPIHTYNGLVMTAAIILHFILNWTWVKNTFFSKKPKSA